MFRTRPLAALLFSTCLLTSALPATTLAQTAQVTAASVHAQGKRVLLDAVAASVRQNPALADGVGNKALLRGVERSVWQRPELQESIVASAKSIRPALSYEIDLAAQNTLAAIPAPQVHVPAAPEAVATTQAPASGGYRPVPNAATPAKSTSMLGSMSTTSKVVLGAALAAGTAGVIIATQSGGSSSDGGAAPSPSPSPALFNTAEYRNQWGLAAINASTAYARGANGSGVTVAVLDTGLLVTHPDIDGNVNPNGYNYIENNTNVNDTDGHGTHVAGTIGAERDGANTPNNIHGVAYGAKILPVRIIGEIIPGGEPIATTSTIMSGTNWATARGAKVLNGSYGPDFSDPAVTVQNITLARAFEASSYLAAVESGMVLVFAAGNNYQSNPVGSANPTGAGLFPYIRPANANTGVYNDGGANYDFSSLDGMLLAVVATQQNGTIAPFSNRCGVAADWCLAAPGTNILSLSHTGGYTTKSGTSMATPHVSGAVAVLIDMFPELTPQEIVQRLLISANKSGIYANESVYGQGFLDLGRATNPIGSLNVATGASVHDTTATFALAQSNLNLGPAFGDGLRAALVGQKLAVFDQQNATFVVDLADFTRTADSRFNLDESLRRFRSRFGAQTLQLGENAQLSYTVVDLGQNGHVRHDPMAGEQGTSMEMAYSQQIGGVEWKMNYNVSPSTLFGIHQSQVVDGNAMLSRDAFAAPYLSFARQGYSVGSHVPLNDTFSLNVGAFRGHTLTDELMAPEDRAESFGQVAELAYKKRGIKVFTQMGMLSEKQTFLGSRSQGAFDLDSGTHTSFAGVNSAYAIGDNWNLVGSYYRGLSTPQLDSHSLFDSISDVQTESFSVGLIGDGILHEGDSLGFVGNQPLRVTNGEASMSLATGRSRSGALYKQAYDVNLAPTGREMNLEAFYHFSLPDTQTQLMSSLMYRNEPGHIENAPDEGVFLLQMQQPF